MWSDCLDDASEGIIGEARLREKRFLRVKKEEEEEIHYVSKERGG